MARRATLLIWPPSLYSPLRFGILFRFQVWGSFGVRFLVLFCFVFGVWDFFCLRVWGLWSGGAGYWAWAVGGRAFHPPGAGYEVKKTELLCLCLNRCDFKLREQSGSHPLGSRCIYEEGSQNKFCRRTNDSRCHPPDSNSRHLAHLPYLRCASQLGCASKLGDTPTSSTTSPRWAGRTCALLWGYNPV